MNVLVLVHALVLEVELALLLKFVFVFTLVLAAVLQLTIGNILAEETLIFSGCCKRFLRRIYRSTYEASAGWRLFSFEKKFG